MTLRVPFSLMTAALLGCAFVAPLAAQDEGEPLRVFLRSGPKTHNFPVVNNGQHDYPAFLADWSKILLERGVTADGALHFPSAERLANTDVMVIYAGDGGMVSPTEREALDAYLRRGGGIVVLHDGMCSDDASWFATIVGAAKQHGEMNWSRGILKLHVVDREHPITRGVEDFEMNDEAFFLLRQAPEMHALMESPIPEREEVVPQAWVYEKTIPGGQPHRAFVWMQGHYTAKLLEPQNRDLVLRAIAWAGKRPVDELLKVRPPRRPGPPPPPGQ
ncbi:MAG: ThuA domain-containing protein [Acidobacteria bacterium]|jgi:type 1 glutamine amidotransferase|nr:ThuA domain-containing protein [Acidobacteriota bacterium]